VFAYGQTGSGKSYSISGYGKNKGLTSKICEELFNTINANPDPELTSEVKVSIYEIYNEKVHDLLK